MQNDSKKVKPFGLEFLSELAPAEATQVNGGTGAPSLPPRRLGPGPYNSFGLDPKTGQTILDTI